MPIKQVSFKSAPDQQAIDRQQLLAQAMMQRAGQGTPQSWNSMPVVPNGAGEALPQLISALVGGFAQKNAMDKQGALDTKTRAGNDTMIEALTRQSNPMMMKRDDNNLPMPGTEAPRVNEVQSGHPAMSPNGQAMSQMMAGGDPAQAKQLLMQAMASKLMPKPEEDYTLTPGAARFKGGTQIAAMPAAAKQTPMPQHTAEGLVFDPVKGVYKDPDGNVLDAAGVKAWRTSMAADRTTATTNAKTKATADTGSSLTPQAIDLAADRMLNGEKARDVLANFGRGTQGAADIRVVQNRFAAKAAEQGMDAADIATKVQELGAENRTRLELGAREGKIAPRVQEAQDFAKLAIERSKDVPRGNSTDINKAIQFGDAHFSDPKLAAFNAANISLINAYAAAIGGGSVHVHDQEVGQKMLQTIAGEKGYEAAVNQIIRETETALKAPGKVMDSMRPKKGPTVGAIEGGYKFKGGDPSKPESWEKQ